jgi:20S proteasome alpha/beta subunit
MTLTICIIARDGIVLASDSRATVGDPRAQTAINEPVKKIFALGKHTGIGIAGDSGLALTIIDEFLKDISPCGEMAIFEMVERLRLKCVDLYNGWFPYLPPMNRPGLEIMIAGYTSGEKITDQKPEAYTLRSSYNFAPLKSAMGFQAIGLPYLAHYILNTLYRPEININKAALLAAFSIEETSSQDAKVGSEVQIASFSNTREYFEYTKTEINNIKLECETFREGMKEQIYGKAVKELKAEDESGILS